MCYCDQTVVIRITNRLTIGGRKLLIDGWLKQALSIGLSCPKNLLATRLLQEAIKVAEGLAGLSLSYRGVIVPPSRAGSAVRTTADKQASRPARPGLQTSGP